MRIAIDCRKIADFGIGRYLRGLLGGLAAVRADETFVLLGPRRIEPAVPSGLVAERVEADAPHYSLSELVILARAAGRARADVYHAPHYVVPLVGAPVVVTIHDLIHLRTPHRNPLKPLYARAMLGRAVRRSRAILTVSGSVRDEIAARWPASAAKLESIPNGVDDRFFEPRHPEDEAAVRRMGVEAGHFVLYVGNDKPHKNLDGLAAAWRLLRDELPQTRLALAGARPARFASEPGVVCLGFVDDPSLARLYRCATLVVLPSLHEGFGLPLAEAMASGTPVVCSDLPALREIGGDAVRLTDSRDPRALADAILAVVRDAAARDAMIRAGRARADQLRWETTARRTLAVYRAAAGRERKSATRAAVV